MKIRMLMPVLAVLLVFGLANTAFAQQNCSVSSTPVSRAADTGHTEVVGDLIFACTAGINPTTTATITIDYGVTVTDSTAYPNVGPVGTGPIRIANATGTFLGATSISSVNNATGQIVINVLPQAVPVSGGFTVSGVLASFAGSGKTTLNANVSVSPGANILIVAGQNNATVVTTVLKGIQDPKLTTTSPPSSGVLLSSGIVSVGSFLIDISENYIDAYKNVTQFNGGNAFNSVQLLLTFAGIPSGVSLNNCVVVSSSGTPQAAFTGTGRLTATDNTATLSFAAGVGPDISTIDKFTFGCATINVSSSATIPLTPGNITVTATLAPTGSALSSGGNVLNDPTTTGKIPRYANTPLPSPPLTVIVIAPAQTNFLIPFVVSEGGFDTGLAIANTTTDPFGATFGARAQNGAITFNIYPRTGSSCVVTPSSSTVGIGLTSAGLLESGRTYTVLLSELLRVAGSNCPATMTGYIIAVANFTHGHGAAFVTNFTGFTSSSNVLIIFPPSLPGGARNLNVSESLAF